jgi:hypothetical protein
MPFVSFTPFFSHFPTHLPRTSDPIIINVTINHFVLAGQFLSAPPSVFNEIVSLFLLVEFDAVGVLGLNLTIDVQPILVPIAAPIPGRDEDNTLLLGDEERGEAWRERWVRLQRRYPN